VEYVYSYIYMCVKYIIPRWGWNHTKSS
jgi:hypothetical protein